MVSVIIQAREENLLSHVFEGKFGSSLFMERHGVLLNELQIGRVRHNLGQMGFQIGHIFAFDDKAEILIGMLKYFA